jgi:transcriptional regulator of acetoin/glycerol metabolism
MKKPKALKQIAEEATQTAIKTALLDVPAQCNSNVAEAAALLGISRFNAYRMLRRCGLEFSRELTQI